MERTTPFMSPTYTSRIGLTMRNAFASSVARILSLHYSSSCLTKIFCSQFSAGDCFLLFYSVTNRENFEKIDELFKFVTEAKGVAAYPAVVRRWIVAPPPPM